MRAGNHSPQHSFDLVCILGVYAAVMLAFAMTALAWEPLHADMTEAWAWGKEFQLGYSKHPMASAWMAGAWFAVMPRTSWSFYLLSVANAAVGLAGVWMLAGVLLRWRERVAALIFLMLTPAYTVWALKFNANSVLLSSWPWTTYFFLVSLQKRSMVFGALAGLAGGIALLSKYYSIVLIATLFVVAALHPDRRRYFGSAVPYLTIAVGLVVVAPHIWWLVDADFSPLRYAFSKTEYPEARARAYALWAVIESYALLGLGVIAFAVAFGRQSWPLLQRSLRATILPDAAWLVWLAHGPLILTVVAYLASNVRITGSYLMPVFFALPVAFLACSKAHVSTSALKRLALATAAVWVPVMIALPLATSYAFEHAAEDQVEPRQELALAVTRFWHEQFNRPLRFIGGSAPLATAATFYSPDTPSYVVIDNPSLSPWARPQDIEQEGALIVCRLADKSCRAGAQTMVAGLTQPVVRSFQHRFMGQLSPRQSFVIFVLPPAAAALVR